MTKSDVPHAGGETRQRGSLAGKLLVLFLMLVAALGGGTYVWWRLTPDSDYLAAGGFATWLRNQQIELPTGAHVRFEPGTVLHYHAADGTFSFAESKDDAFERPGEIVPEASPALTAGTFLDELSFENGTSFSLPGMEVGDVGASAEAAGELRISAAVKNVVASTAAEGDFDRAGLKARWRAPPPDGAYVVVQTSLEADEIAYAVMKRVTWLGASTLEAAPGALKLEGKGESTANVDLLVHQVPLGFQRLRLIVGTVHQELEVEDLEAVSRVLAATEVPARVERDRLVAEVRPDQVRTVLAAAAARRGASRELYAMRAEVSREWSAQAAATNDRLRDMSAALASATAKAEAAEERLAALGSMAAKRDELRDRWLASASRTLKSQLGRDFTLSASDAELQRAFLEAARKNDAAATGALIELIRSQTLDQHSR